MAPSRAWPWALLLHPVTTSWVAPAEAAAQEGQCEGPQQCNVVLVQKLSRSPCHPGVNFGCYTGDAMWVAGGCRAFFRCGPEEAIRCGAMGSKDGAMGAKEPHVRKNCSCTTKNVQSLLPPAPGCASVKSGDLGDFVSSAFRRLPQPPASDASVRCCRNKGRGLGHANGAVNWTSTLKFSALGAAAWPEQCEAACAGLPGCRFFSHSLIHKNCIHCATCDQPEVPVGDGSYSSWEYVGRTGRSAPVERLYIGMLEKFGAAAQEGRRATNHDRPRRRLRRNGES